MGRKARMDRIANQTHNNIQPYPLENLPAPSDRLGEVNFAIFAMASMLSEYGMYGQKADAGGYRKVTWLRVAYYTLILLSGLAQMFLGLSPLVAGLVTGFAAVAFEALIKWYIKRLVENPWTDLRKGGELIGRILSVKARAGAEELEVVYEGCWAIFRETCQKAGIAVPGKDELIAHAREKHDIYMLSPGSKGWELIDSLDLLMRFYTLYQYFWHVSRVKRELKPQTETAEVRTPFWNWAIAAVSSIPKAGPLFSQFLGLLKQELVEDPDSREVVRKAGSYTETAEELEASFKRAIEHREGQLKTAAKLVEEREGKSLGFEVMDYIHELHRKVRAEHEPDWGRKWKVSENLYFPTIEEMVAFFEGHGVEAGVLAELQGRWKQEDAQALPKFASDYTGALGIQINSFFESMRQRAAEIGKLAKLGDPAEEVDAA